MEDQPYEAHLKEKYPIIGTLEIENWERFYDIISGVGKINVAALQEVSSSEMSRSDKTRVLNHLEALVNPEDFLFFVDNLPPEILQKIVDKSMVDFGITKDPIYYHQLMKAAFKLDDVDSLNILFGINENHDMNLDAGRYLPLARSVDAFELIEHQMDVKNIKEYFLKVAEIAPLSYLKSMISKYKLDIHDFSKELLLHAIKGDELSIVKYLVEVHDVSVTSEVLISAIYYGSAIIVDYFIISKPEIFASEALIVLSDNKKYRVTPKNAEESIEFFSRRVETLGVLLKSPMIDPSMDESKVLKMIYPKFNRENIGREMTEEIDHVISQYLLILLSDPRVKPMKGIIEAFQSHNEHAIRVIVEDYRFNIMETIDIMTEYESYQNYLPLVMESLKETGWNFQKINSIQGMSNYDKYQLFVSLNPSEMDDRSSKLLKNVNFQIAYLSTNDELANMLNDRKIPLISHINHGAAAALYAGDMDNFKLLVPRSTYEEYIKLL